METVTTATTATAATAAPALIAERAPGTPHTPRTLAADNRPAAHAGQNPATPRATPAARATLGEAITRHGVDVDPHLDRQLLIPVLAGLQAQGDVLVVPRDREAAAEPVPRDGIAVVRGEFGGNTHTLLAEGDVRFDRAPQDGESLDLGVLTVAEGAVAYLAHPEHAYSGIAPGTYLLRRQREVDASRVLPRPAAVAPAPRTPPAPRVRYVAD